MIEVCLDEDDDVLEMLEQSSREEKLRLLLTNAVDSGYVDKIGNLLQSVIAVRASCHEPSGHGRPALNCYEPLAVCKSSSLGHGSQGARS